MGCVAAPPRPVMDLVTATAPPRRAPSPAPSPRGLRVGDVEWVALDTETTGLWWGDRVVELGAVRFRGARVIDRWRTLVDPGVPIPARVSALHGITDDAVRGAPTAPEVLPLLARFCEGARVIAHHAPYDRDILATEFARAALSPPDGALDCSLVLSRVLAPDAPGHGLARLARHLGVADTQAHRALADAELTRDVFRAMVPDDTELEALVAMQRARGGPFAWRGDVRALPVPREMRVLDDARRAGEAVTLGLASGASRALIRAVPGALYARGDDAWLDVRAVEDLSSWFDPAAAASTSPSAVAWAVPWPHVVMALRRHPRSW